MNCDEFRKYNIDFLIIEINKLLFKVLLFFPAGALSFQVQLLSNFYAGILFLPSDGTLKIK
ncbi:hypothetical protein ERIG_00384 [Escherichia fergusonii B253]|nr:hypothetical protein ERIG_00384 [Escherichia fergusonii B253]